MKSKATNPETIIEKSPTAALVPLTDVKSLRYSSRLLPVEVGQVITIMGKTKESAEFFDFFLGTDDGLSSDFGDVQLHVSVKFTGSRCIARNCYTKGIGWEDHEENEENLLAHNNRNPIKRGGDFKISIYVDESMFYLIIDDKPFCSFAHRKPIADIKRLNIYGDVEHICQVNHSRSNIHEAHPINKANFSGSLPALVSETAIVFIGTCKGAPEDARNEHLVISLIEVSTGKVLIQVISNFDKGVVVAITQNDDQG